MRDLKARARAGPGPVSDLLPSRSRCLPGSERAYHLFLHAVERERGRELERGRERERELEIGKVGERGREWKQIHSLTLCTFIHSIYTLTHRRRGKKGGEAREVREEGRRGEVCEGDEGRRRA